MIELSALAAEHWQGAARGELRVPHCRNCDNLWFPPAKHCPRCLLADIEWSAISRRGQVRGACVFHRSYIPGLDLAVPYTVVHVRLDAGPQLYGNPADPGETLAVGDAVEAVFVPYGEHAGLVRFRRVEEGA